MWDCHARLGGATGTQMTQKECPPSTTSVDQGCKAGSLILHITSGSSGYFENMWLWVADHNIDDLDLTQTPIYVARGMLIESKLPTWLYGTASEHAVFCQYNFNNAANVSAGLLQTESAYYQPNPQPPAPFTDVVGKISGDPSYKCTAGDELNSCDASWSTIIRGSSNIFIGGAGLLMVHRLHADLCRHVIVSAGTSSS